VEIWDICQVLSQRRILIGFHSAFSGHRFGPSNWNSQLGVFLQCSILAFDSMTFEVLRVEEGIREDLFITFWSPFFLI
jgi:hypothetical protein